MPSVYNFDEQKQLAQARQAEAAQRMAVARKNAQTVQPERTAQMPVQITQNAPPKNTAQNGTGFTGYSPSQAVISAQQYLQDQIANKPGAYASKYNDQLESILGQIQNREPFKYDAAADPLYNIYKDLYIQNGRRAMMDTIGNAAALTGGYGNSYAQSAGQQMYNQYMEALNARVPELQQQAYQRYSDEGDRMVQSWQMYNTLENQNFNQYQTALSAWQNERALAQDAAAQALQFDMQRYQYDTDAAYRQTQADLAAQQWQMQFDENVRQYDTDAAYRQAQADLAAEQWLKNYEESIRQYNQNFGEDQRQYDASLAEKQREFDIAQALNQAEFDLTMRKYEDALAQAAGSGSGGNGGSTPQQTPQTQPSQPTQPTETAAQIQNVVSNFINYVADEKEFKERKLDKRYASYDDYIADKVTSFIRDDRLTNNEALAVLDYYMGRK